MSTSFQIECEVCYETKPLARIRILPACGHGFCNICVERLTECPNCRTLFRRRDPLRVFLKGPSVASTSSVQIRASGKPNLARHDDANASEIAAARSVSQAFEGLHAYSGQEEVQAAAEALRTLAGCIQSPTPDVVDDDDDGSDVTQACLRDVSQYITRISFSPKVDELQLLASITRDFPQRSEPEFVRLSDDRANWYTKIMFLMLFVYVVSVIGVYHNLNARWEKCVASYNVLNELVMVALKQVAAR